MATFRVLFRVGCVLLSFCATIWPIYLFNLDEDSVEIEFKDLHTNKNTPYPALTLCFDHSMIHEYNMATSNWSMNDEQRQHTFSTRTLQINDYIGSIVIKHLNEKQTQLVNTGTKMKPHDDIKGIDLFSNTVLQRYESTDCIDVGIPFQENKGIHSIDVEIRKSALKSETVPIRNEIMTRASKLTIGLSFHGDTFLLPNQNPRKPRVYSPYNQNCFGIAFNLSGMETLQLRNKPSNPCTDYESHSSFKALNFKSKIHKCTPFIRKVPSILSDCPEKNLNRSDRELPAPLTSSNHKRNTKPCHSIMNVHIDYNSQHLLGSCTNDSDTFHVTAFYNNFSYKETILVRAYTVWNLISSIGVIIGLFFGVSLIQLPDIFRKLTGAKYRKTWFESPTKEKAKLLTLQMENQTQDYCTKHLEEMKKERFEADKEIKTIKEDIYLFKNHMIQLLQKHEYETVV